MGVTVASRLERLVRFVPGVAGYQDREHSRATDKQVRMRLVQEIRRLIQGLDDDKERLARAAHLSPPPPLALPARPPHPPGRVLAVADPRGTLLFSLSHPVAA